MQWLASICVKRPVFATVLILALTVVGAFAFTRLGLDRFPKVDFPTVVVTTALPGAAPEEVETEISQKIEEAVNTISGIDELRSTSSEGVSIVIVSFQLEKDADVAAQEVRDRVNRVIPQLPRTIQQPTVEKFDPDAAPVLMLAVSANKPIRDITEYADKTLRRQLESVDGVGQVTLVGGRQRQVNVWLDAARLQAYNLTVTDVSRALQAQNAETPGGRVEAGAQALTLRTRGRVQSVQEFGDVVVRQRDAHPVLLSDVATIEDGMADATTKANISGEPTVLLSIRRQSGTNTVQVVDAIKERLEDLKAVTPPGFNVRVVRDQSEFIRASIDTVEDHLVLGSILAALVVLVFLWNWRSTLIAAIAIPTSIIATFGLIWYEGFTLNSMTMLALTLAVGIVIDDAIVVLENIYRFVEEKGQPPFQAAIEATREIGLAVLATTLSLIAIFVPVGFMGGIVGRFMKSFGLTMSFAILVSLLVSFTLTPMLSARWIKSKGSKDAKTSKESRFFAPIDRRYSSVLSWALGHRGIIAGVAVLILLSSVPLFVVAKKNFLPNDDQSEFEIGLRAPEGTSLDATELIANRIAAQVRRLPEVDYTLVTIADDPSVTQNAGTIYVRLKALGERSRDQFTVMNAVRDRVLPQFASANLRTGVRPVAMMGGGGNQNADIQFTINGPDLGKLQQYADTVAAEARKTAGVVDVDTSLNAGKPEVSVRVDRLKAADLGVQIADAAEALRLLVGGDQVTTYNEGGEQYEVHVRALGQQRDTASAIGQLTVPSSRVGSVPLENIAALTPGTAPSNVDRLNRQRQVTVFAGLLPGASQTPAMNAMTKAADALNMGPGYSTRFAGRSRELGRAAENFLIAFVLSLVFMYLILAAQFESWLHPVTILLSLPLTLPFALLSIIIAGQSLNIFSALGLLVLFGVVKKNSILQIDHANQLRERGMERDSAILQASRDRLRPILMTTFAFVAGMIPLVVSSGIGAGTNRAIGFVIIGGQSLVLVLSLVVTPVAYSLFDDLAKVRLLSRGRLRRAAALAQDGAATATILVVMLGLGAAEARAQQAPGPIAQQPGATQAGPTITLTADQVTQMAIANNPDLVAAKYDPRVAAERVGQAKSAFLPTLQSAVQRNVQNAPPTSIFFGNTGVRTDVWSGNIGLSQRLPWGGGSYNVLWNSARTNASSTLSNFNPSVTAQIQGVLSQPLLRDFKIDPYRAQLVTSERNREIADVGVQELGVSVTANAQRAYWNLVLANASVTVQQRALDLAMELERNNKARVDVGQSPPLDLVAARAEAAQRRENLIVAQTQVRQAEDALRILILDPSRPDFWTVRLQVADLVPPIGPEPDVDAAVRFALQNRTDLVRTRKQIAIADTNVTLAKSEVLPDLRVQANYLTAGLGGTELIRNGGIFGPVVGTSPLAFGNVLRQTFVGDYPTWTVGFTLSYPLGRSNEEAALARTELEREQTQARLRAAELHAVREIRSAAMQLDQNRQRIETTRLARELSEQRLDAEQKRYEVGMSTNFNVIQAQRDLAVAQNNELQAQLDYEIALINFETVQRVSASTGAATGASTPTTTSGSSTSFGTAGSASAPAATTTSGGSGGGN